MKLLEVKDPRVKVGLTNHYIALPRGSVWQKDIHNVWMFDTLEAARKASHTELARKILDNTMGDYLYPIETLTGVPLLIQFSPDGYDAVKGYKNFRVYAYSISQKSAQAQAEQVMNDHGIGGQAWVYRTWGSDPSYFDEEEE